MQIISDKAFEIIVNSWIGEMNHAIKVRQESIVFVGGPKVQEDRLVEIGLFPILHIALVATNGMNVFLRRWIGFVTGIVLMFVKDETIAVGTIISSLMGTIFF